jgi:hypothetical protein
MPNLDFLWPLTAFLLTCLVLIGYLLGTRSTAFRLAAYLLIGVAAGVLAVVIIYQVLVPRLLWPLTAGTTVEKALTIVPLILGWLLLFKLSRKFAWAGNLSLAFVVGVAAAVVIGGAVLGTLFGQLRGVFLGFDLKTAGLKGIAPQFQLADGFFMLFGTITSLAYFHFTARPTENQAPRRSTFINALADIGQVFIAITLGSLFAGVYTAAITALIERLGFLWLTISNLHL